MPTKSLEESIPSLKLAALGKNGAPQLSAVLGGRWGLRHSSPGGRFVLTRLITERGEVLDELVDSSGVIDRLVPPLSEDGSPCWRFIDPYGDTVFNNLQMPSFLLELEVLRGKATGPTSHILARLEAMAKRCRDEVHLYLKFVGD
jgi:hypothetical protein